MALPATTVWEVRPTNGSNTNGGGFVSGGSGTDYSQQNAKNTVGSNISATDIVANGTTTLTSATINGDSHIVDNIIYLQGGTGSLTAGWYRVATFVSNSGGITTITVDRTVATGTGITCNIGGAIQTLGQMHTILTTTNQNATGQAVYVKAEATISVTAGITLSPNGGTNSQATQINGYTSSRTDNGQVTIQRSSGTGFTILTMQPSGPVILRNFIIDGNSGGTIQGGSFLGSYIQIENCLFENCPSGGAAFNNTNNKAIRCTATANGSFGFTCDQGNGPNVFIDCVAYANTGTGFATAVSMFLGCIAANNTGGSTDGFGGSNGIGKNSSYAILINCVAYGNGRDGFRLGSAVQCNVVIENCIGYSNSGKDIQAVTNAVTAGGLTLDHNAWGTTTNVPTGNTGDVVLTADPFVAGGSNNFALNNTAGGGALCRAAGFPGVLSVGGTGYSDMGALQHQDSPAVVIASNITRVLLEES